MKAKIDLMIWEILMENEEGQQWGICFRKIGIHLRAVFFNMEYLILKLIKAIKISNLWSKNILRIN